MIKLIERRLQRLKIMKASALLISEESPESGNLNVAKLVKRADTHPRRPHGLSQPTIPIFHASFGGLDTNTKRATGPGCTKHCSIRTKTYRALFCEIDFPNGKKRHGYAAHPALILSCTVERGSVPAYQHLVHDSAK